MIDYLIVKMSKSTFKKQLEYHKIPEYYDEYFQYHSLKLHIKAVTRRRLSKLSLLISVAKISPAQINPQTWAIIDKFMETESLSANHEGNPGSPLNKSA
jgi:hypothetical protein